ncbi:unnamed protein product, partial [Prorocentrum cordatum]
MAAAPPRRRSPRAGAAAPRGKSQGKTAAARAPERKVNGEARRRLGHYLHRDPQLEQAWHHQQSVLGTELLGERSHAMHEVPEFAAAFGSRAGRQSSNVHRNGDGGKKMMAAQALREALEKPPPRPEGVRTYASEAVSGATHLELGDGGEAAGAPGLTPRFEGCAGSRSGEQPHAKQDRGLRTYGADGRNSAETERRPAPSTRRHLWWEQQQAQRLMFGGLDAALASEPQRGDDRAEASFHGAAGQPAIRAQARDARGPECSTGRGLSHKALTERGGHDRIMSMPADEARAAMSTFGDGAGKATWEPLRRALMAAPPEGDMDRGEPYAGLSVAAEAGHAEKFAGRAGKGTWERSSLLGASSCVSPRITRAGPPPAWLGGGAAGSRAGEVIFQGRCGIAGESRYRADFSGEGPSGQAHAGVASWERPLEWSLPPGRGRPGPASRSTPALRTQAWGPPPEAASPRAATPRRHAGAAPPWGPPPGAASPRAATPRRHAGTVPLDAGGLSTEEDGPGARARRPRRGQPPPAAGGGGPRPRRGQ